MLLNRVKVIEDKGSIFGKPAESGGIPYRTNKHGIVIQDHYVFNEPMNIQEVEYFEERLEMLGKPYVVLQAEVTIEEETGDRRYSKGYVILTKPFPQDNLVGNNNSWEKSWVAIGGRGGIDEHFEVDRLVKPVVH